MVGGEWRQPMDGEVVGPDEEDGDVDGEDPDHEDEDGVGVVVEIIMGPGPLFPVRTTNFLGRSGVNLQFREATATPACKLIVVQGQHLGMRTGTE